MQQHQPRRPPVARLRRPGQPAPRPGLALAAPAPPPSTSPPAKDAANPACAPMMVALPDTIGDAKLRKTNSQATAAWGDPSLVILRCGVNVPGPTTDRCVTRQRR